MSLKAPNGLRSMKAAHARQAPMKTGIALNDAAARLKKAAEARVGLKRPFQHLTAALNANAGTTSLVCLRSTFLLRAGGDEGKGVQSCHQCNAPG